MVASTGDEPARLLMVCTGNIARSPLAAAMLRKEVERRDLDRWVGVDSAGIHARSGLPAVEGSRKAAAERGLSLEDHRSKPVSEELIAGADLILTMTERQRAYVAGQAGGELARVFTLKEFHRLAGVGPPGPAGSARRYVRSVVGAAHGRRPRHAPEQRPEDITDPFGGPPRAFEEMAEKLARLCGDLAVVLLG